MIALPLQYGHPDALNAPVEVGQEQLVILYTLVAIMQNFTWYDRIFNYKPYNLA